jgi:adenylate cyclase
MAADVAGYSRLMHDDEETTHARLTALLADVIKPTVAEHGGRIVKNTGDGFLAEFSSAVQAVRAAARFQSAVGELQKNDAEDRRLLFRVGINIGDVIVEPHDIFGDGVNIAARLEGIAEPGGTCISSSAYDQVRGKVDIAFEDMGPQALKNIAEPIRVWRVKLGSNTRSAAPTAVPAGTSRPLALPDKPSIAVLPFQNMSGDPEQEYFADGMVEDIITALSRFKSLFVIARNSSFTYKGKAVDIKQVGRELGVRYVLEGSVRKAGNRLRITAQLVEAETGNHLWAERYDRVLMDVFAIQDEAARTIAAMLTAHVNKAEVERTLLKPPLSWEAYDYYMRAANTFTSYWSSYEVEEVYEARRLLERSISLDPKYARAYAMLSNTHTTVWAQPLDGDYLNPAALVRACELASKAVRLDPGLPQAHALLGMALNWMHQHDASLEAFEKAIALNPNYTDWRFASALVLAGEPTRAIRAVEAHMRLDPFYLPTAPSWLGLSYYLLNQYQKALSALRECATRAPNLRGGHVLLAATYAQMGRLEEARAETAEVLRLEPRYTIQGTQSRLYGFKLAEHAEHLFDGLRKAGLPD